MSLYLRALSMQGPGELTALDLVRRCHAALYAAASLPAGLEQLRTVQPALGAVAQLYRTYTVVMPPDRRCVGRTSLLRVSRMVVCVCCTASLAVHMAYCFGCVTLGHCPAAHDCGCRERSHGEQRQCTVLDIHCDRCCPAAVPWVVPSVYVPPALHRRAAACVPGVQGGQGGHPPHHASGRDHSLLVIRCPAHPSHVRVPCILVALCKLDGARHACTCQHDAVMPTCVVSSSTTFCRSLIMVRATCTRRPSRPFAHVVKGSPCNCETTASYVIHLQLFF
jgi:hypothetical protein